MVELIVAGMRCGGCAARVTQAVKALDDEALVQVDLPRKAVRIDSAAAPDAILAALKAAGYPAEEA